MADDQPATAAQPEPQCPQPPICSACPASLPCRPDCHICHPVDTAAFDAYACQACGCHHHTTEQHDDLDLAAWGGDWEADDE